MRKIFKPGAGVFFLSILIWGIGIGCFMAAMNNFLAEVCHMTEADRGMFEFFRELPGLALIFILALLHKVSDWKIMRLGTIISMLGALLLLIPSNDKIFVTATIMIWSLGEHVVMPVRSAIAMSVVDKENAGKSLGLLTSIMNFGNVAGNIIVAIIFFVGTQYLELKNHVLLYDIVWGFIALLMLISIISTFSKKAPQGQSQKPRLYFNKHFSKFYALELFYGARKQIFITFAPYLLIKEYDLNTAEMAILFGVCAIVNVFVAPLIGKITDVWGYRKVMIWDTIILFFVCLLYGYAGKLFVPQIAIIVLCVNFMLDTILSTTSLATNIYARSLSRSQDELTSTISTGISINHLISIIAAPIGGFIWAKYGVEVLFLFAAIMAIFNSIFAWTISKQA